MACYIDIDVVRGTHIRSSSIFVLNQNKNGMSVTISMKYELIYKTVSRI